MSAPLPDVVNIDAHPVSVDHPVHATDSDELLFWWAHVLGPTGCLVAHRVARYTSSYGPADWPLDELAVLVGVNRAKLVATFDRLQYYGVLLFIDCGHALIRLALPPLSERRLRHLPEHLASEYRDRFGTSRW